jgi:hypothetical protein
MKIRHRIAIPTLSLAIVMAGSGAASAAGGNGESACSQSGRVEWGGQTIIDTFGHAVVAPTVQAGAGFSGSSNPGHGFDLAYGQTGDGPVAPSVCRPQR